MQNSDVPQSSATVAEWIPGSSLVKPEHDEPVGVPFLEGGLEAVTSLGLWLRLPDFLNGHVQRRFKGVPQARNLVFPQRSCLF